MMTDNHLPVISFRLKRDRDSDIIAWLRGIPERDRSYKIRAALRAYMGMAAAPVQLQPAAATVASPATGQPNREPEPPLKAKEPEISELERALDGWLG